MSVLVVVAGSLDAVRAGCVAVGLTLLSMVCLEPARALAEEKDRSKLDAAAEYDAAVAAQAHGDFAAAAKGFARADELLSNDVALELALQFSLQADDPVTGMAIVERASRRTLSLRAVELARAVRARAETRVGHLVLQCRPAIPCDASVEEIPLPAGGAWFLPGDYLVRVRSGTTTTTSTLHVEAQRVARVHAADPIPLRPDRSPAHDNRRLSPVWFLTGVGVTATTGVVAAISTADTLHLHSRFEQEHSDTLAEDGRTSERRTYLLWGATALALVATAAIGLFFTR